MNYLHNETKIKPKLIIVIGVSGSGKSTVAEQLSKLFGWHFMEADNFHSLEAKVQMGRNIPLTDEQRAPWIECLCNNLVELAANNQNVVLAFSGLKAKYRQHFRTLPFDRQFFLLHGDPLLIEQRMATRNQHFANVGLLESQLSTLELPQKNETDITTVDIKHSINEIVSIIKDNLNEKLAS